MAIMHKYIKLKIIITCVFIIFNLCLFAKIVFANDLANAVDALDLTELNRFMGTLENDTVRLLPNLDPKSWGVTGPNWDWSNAGKDVLRYFVREIIFNLRLLGEIILLAMSLAILQNLQHSFESDSVSRIAYSICFLVIIGIVMNSFRVTFAIAKELIGEMTAFMHAITPVMFSLIAAGGGMTTTLIVHPLLIAAIGVVTGVVNNIIFPLILFAGVLGIVNYIGEGFQLKKLAILFKKAALGLMGLTMVIFIGIITIRGFVASVADSTALRTAKYCTNNFLPVVGGVISDTMEMAVGCSMVLESGLGVFGLGFIILIALFPLIKILAVAIVYNLTGAVLQPLGNNRLADALETVGETFFNLFGVLAIVCLMFFITLSVLVGIANFGMV